MIGRLTGRVVEEGDEGTVVLDVNGVGYEITVPLGTVGRARGISGLTAADPITLFVHTHVREDALNLYGFASRADRAVFRTLIGISSIGPKSAVTILSSITAEELAGAIARRETGRLTAIPGIGKKTAERLVLELKDKLLDVAPSPLAASAAAPAAAASNQGELLHSALTRMGYRPAEADRAVASLAGRIDAAPLGDLVRDALALLAS